MKNKRILVTGGAGFIGSNLIAELVSDNEVVSLDNYFAGTKERHVGGVRYIEGHTKDILSLIDEKFDLVYHFGEYSRVEISLHEPDVVWDLNMVGTFAVLEFCKKHGSKIVYAGSSTKFGDGGMGRFDSPYAWTKAANTELVQNYGRWYRVSHAIVYFYNVYGPGERAGKYGTLIEKFKQKHNAGEKLTVVAPGTQRRNFTHVDDVVSALLLVGEKGSGDEFGIGYPESYSVLDIAHLFGGEVEMLPERKGNRMDATIDTSKTEALGWKPSKSIESYIEEIKDHG